MQLDNFKLTNYIGYNISLSREDVELSPLKLRIMLGPPKTSDNYKVSGKYTFIHVESGEIFTLYDWKSTSLYNSQLESPDLFWNREKALFHIGSTPRGRVYVDDLVRELQSIYKWTSPSINEQDENKDRLSSFFIGGNL